MADTISPWIAAYFLKIAEEHGCKLNHVLLAKGKKVQLVKFLTYDAPGEDDYLWAMVSDGQYKVPVRLSGQAVAEFDKRASGRRQSAVVRIGKFTPMWTRVPTGTGERKMSVESTLALDVLSAVDLGSHGEGEWRQPKTLEKHKDINEWMIGLGQHGGAGNVLMIRKEEREAPSIPTATPTPQFVVASPPKPFAENVASTSNKAPSPKAQERVLTEEGKKTASNLAKSYERRWRPKVKDSVIYASQPDDVKDKLRKLSAEPTDPFDVQPPPAKRRRVGPVQHALDLSSSQPLADVLETPKRGHERNAIDTPQPNEKSSPLTDWSVSPGRERVGDASSPPHSPSPLRPSTKPDDSIDLSTSLLSLPTPAQRPKDSQPLPKSSPLPASSLPASTLAPRNLSPARSYPPLLNRRQITRKVPRPPEPLPPNRASNGSEHVLVPNSDTSGSVSQPYSQSQSQSQSQRRASRLSHNVTVLEQFELEIKEQPIPVRRKDVSPSGEGDYDGDLSSGSTNDEDENSDHDNGSAPEDEELTDGQQDDDRDESISDEEEEEVDELQDETDTEQVQRTHSVAPEDDASEDENDELDEDDAQISEQLSGRPTEPIKTEHVSIPAALPSVVTKHSLSPDQQPPVVLPISPESSHSQNVDPTKSSASQQSSSIVSSIKAVEHNAEAWKNPSFIQTSGKGKAKAPAKLVSTRTAAIVLSDTSKTPLEQRPSRPPANKIADKSIDVAPLDAKRKHTEGDAKVIAHTQLSVTTYGDTPSTRKRTRATSSGFDDQEDPSKRRKIIDLSGDASDSSIHSVNHPDPRKEDTSRAPSVVVVKSESANDDAVHSLAKRKLAGFTVNFNSIPSNDETKPMVSWRGLKDILWRIGRSRKKQGVFKEPPAL